MRFILFSLAVMFISMSGLQAQSAYRRIEVKKGFLRNTYTYNELNLNIRDVATIIRKNEQAYNIIKPAKVNYIIGKSLAFIGTAAVIVPLGQIILGSGSRHYWAFAGTGVALYTISLPIIRKAHKQAAKAVERYNASPEN